MTEPDAPALPPKRPSAPITTATTEIAARNRGGYDKCSLMVSESSSEDVHPYEPLVGHTPSQEEFLYRLEVLEEGQKNLRKEVVKLRTDMFEELGRLRGGMETILATLRHSMTQLQASTEQVHSRVMETSDQLGAQVLQMGRDIVNLTKAELLRKK